MIMLRIACTCLGALVIVANMPGNLEFVRTVAPPILPELERTDERV